MTLKVTDIRRCLEGAVPSTIATCALDGTPNNAILSQVHYVDDAHVALSYQFFNKTRVNVLENPRVTVQVVDPDTAAHFRLHLEYMRTETAGPLYESMKAKLAGIASHTGMSKVFRLLGSDIYRVLRIERVPGAESLPAAPGMNRLHALRNCLAVVAACRDLQSVLDSVLECLERQFEIRHSMLLIADRARDVLYTVASRGYATSGVGSEIGIGDGVVGVAARECTPIRIGYAAQEYL